MIIFLIYVIAYRVFRIDVSILYYYPIYVVGLIIRSEKLDRYIFEKNVRSEKVLISIIIYFIVCKEYINLADELPFSNMWFLSLFMLWPLFGFFIFFSVQLAHRISETLYNLIQIISYASFCMYWLHTSYYGMIYSFCGGEIEPICAYVILLPILIAVSFIVQKTYDKLCEKYLK